MALPWRAHSLLGDMEVEDVWRFPVELSAADDLDTFREQMELGVSRLNRLGLTAVLLRIRLAIGQMLGWDRRDHEPRAHRLRERYAAAEGIDPFVAAEEQAGDFSLVYRLDDEYLGEIENRTVLAAIHLGRVPLDEDTAAVHLAIYTLPKGRFGRAYMTFIKPFRLWIVYPAIMRAVAAQWQRHIASRDGAD